MRKRRAGFPSPMSQMSQPLHGTDSSSPKNASSHLRRHVNVSWLYLYMARIPASAERLRLPMESCCSKNRTARERGNASTGHEVANAPRRREPSCHKATEYDEEDALSGSLALTAGEKAISLCRVDLTSKWTMVDRSAEDVKRMQMHFKPSRPARPICWAYDSTFLDMP